MLLTAPAASAAGCQANGLTYAEGTIIRLPDPGTVAVRCTNGQWIS